MRKVFDECVDCGLPCLGSSCPYKFVPRYFCDQCKEETQLYQFNDKELCINCIVSELEKVSD